MKRNIQETRAECIARHADAQIQKLRVSEETVAMRVVEHYHLTVPPEARTVAFRTEGDPFAIAKTNGQRLFRMIDPKFTDTRLPADIEESIVLTLDEPYRSSCLRELARRYGFLAVPIPDDGPAGGITALASFTASLGVALGSIAPILADGKFDESDIPHVRQALSSIEELNEKCAALKQQFLMELGRKALGASR